MTGGTGFEGSFVPCAKASSGTARIQNITTIDHRIVRNSSRVASHPNFVSRIVIHRGWVVAYITPASHNWPWPVAEAKP